MRRMLNLALLAVTLALAPIAVAYDLLGMVVGVMDGDTIDVLTTDKVLVRVRLAGIDAPEKAQPFGAAAKQKLSDLVFAREVVVVWDKKDRYGRTVGKVLVNGADADLRMVESGLAWHYKKYAWEQSVDDQLRYAAAETTARTRRVGLWRDAEPIAPWDFRPKRSKS